MLNSYRSFNPLLIFEGIENVGKSSIRKILTVEVMDQQFSTIERIYPSSYVYDRLRGGDAGSRCSEWIDLFNRLISMIPSIVIYVTRPNKELSNDERVVSSLYDEFFAITRPQILVVENPVVIDSLHAHLLERSHYIFNEIMKSNPSGYKSDKL